MSGCLKRSSCLKNSTCLKKSRCLKKSSDIELEIPLLQFRWTRDPRKTGNFPYWDVRIPEFPFEFGRWHLLYSIHHENDPRVERGEHRLCLRKVSDGPHAPFHASVHVEVGDGSERIVVDGLSCKRHIGSDETVADKIIWKHSDIYVKRKHPDFRRNGFLRFLVVMKKGFKVKDTATQTKYSFPEGFQLHCMDNLSEDFAKLMVQGSDTDVEFRCEGQSFKSHGTIVCARSPVIATMLSSDMVEGRTRIIDIRDMAPEVFQIFLGYIYTGKTPELSFEVAWTLYESADQYAVLGLGRRCSRYLVEQLSDLKALDALVLADAHHDEEFVEEVVDYIVDRNTLKTSERWPSFCSQHPILAKKVVLRAVQAGCPLPGYIFKSLE